MRAGVDRREAAGFLGMSVEMLDRVYGHHHPDHLRTAAPFIGYRPREKLAVPLVGARPTPRRPPQPIEIIGGPRQDSDLQPDRHEHTHFIGKTR
jgi:hypothetical protein